MKNILLAAAFLLLTSPIVHAEKVPLDSVVGLNKVLKDLSGSIKNIKDSIVGKDTTGTKDNTVAKDSTDNAKNNPANCKCNNEGEVSGTMNWVLVFAPVLLFLVVTLFLLWGKGLNSFDFKGALAENELSKITIPNKQYNEANLAKLMTISGLDSVLPPTIEINGTEENIPALIGSANTTTFRPSITRYIAFFSGMLTVIIAVCMASFFIYHYIRTACPPDLSSLSTVLIALGIGVAPYAINKISGAIASNKTNE